MKRAAWLILLASLAANVYLWLTRPTATSQRRAPRAMPITALARNTTASSSAPASASSTSPPSALDRVQLEQRLLRVEAEIEVHLPLEEQYDRASRSSESEARAKVVLDHMFASIADAGSAGIGSPYSLECHGNVCTLQSSLDPADWSQAIQQPPERLMFGSMSFTAERVMFALEPVDKLGELLVRGIYAALGRSTQAELCIAGNANANGSISVTVQFDPAQRRFTGTVGGTLANAPIGVCFRAALDEICARALVPAELTTVPPVDPLDLEFPIQRPH
ncbi:MAG: hypothetical protein HOV81_20725 [Kofleriaceae bacterium]|nr:hypothetical protein [Kofleriaceae bacterium]